MGPVSESIWHAIIFRPGAPFEFELPLTDWPPPPVAKTQAAFVWRPPGRATQSSGGAHSDQLCRRPFAAVISLTLRFVLVAGARRKLARTLATRYGGADEGPALI